MAPQDRTGLLVIRAWLEPGSAAPLRAQIRRTSDIAAGFGPESIVADVAEVGSLVEAWLRDMLADE